ncbi:MAG TPA: Rrf2 family transcriptional regulator [Polyangiaceae bacterium LLY-WYZ-14_1]|nr:Rrf2 family transcriptional regulator [Polyangiaceae bacterium LLY-WYZ-14_1]
MKLSNKGRYGVSALFDIAFHNDGLATQTKDIAERQGIPARFLEQIFQDLKRAGLVTSKRGPKGGYQLARPTDAIRLGDVIRALEGPVQLGPPPDDVKATRGAESTGRQVTDAAFAELSEQIEACFDGKTLADLCAQGEALGLRRQPPRRYVYAI